jgi:hypothetical protein
MSDEFSNDVEPADDNIAEPLSHAENILREPSDLPEYEAPPQSWKREVAERHWGKLDPELRGYLHSREKEAGGKISELGRRASELEGVSTRYQPIDNIFEKYRPHIPEGMEPAQAIEALLNVQQLISTPETRDHALVQLVQNLGVDPMRLLPPQIREQFEATQREFQKVREAEVQRTLDEFTKDKTYYAEIREDVIKEIVEIRKGAPGLDNATVLRLAHDRVVDRTGIKARLDEQAKAEQEGRTAQAHAERLKEMQEQEAKRKEENDRLVKAARRAGGINVKSTPVRAAPKTLDDDLRAIAHRHYG